MAVIELLSLQATCAIAVFQLISTYSCLREGNIGSQLMNTTFLYQSVNVLVKLKIN